MVLKKQHFKTDEVLIYDDAVIYKRGNYWHFRLWLEKQHKYIRRSLQVKDRISAIEKGRSYYLEVQGNLQQGKSYFSRTADEATDLYIKHRYKDVEAKLIVPGRLKALRNQLDNWLKYIGKGSKIYEMTRSSCEDYYHKRTEQGAALNTIIHEQSTINAMMKFMYKQGESYIDGFDFTKLPRVDRGDDSIRRATFKPDEIGLVESAIHTHAAEAYAVINSKKTDFKNAKEKELYDLKVEDSWDQYIICYYFLIAMLSGIRSGEQIQLKWSDIGFTEYKDKSNEVSIIKIRVRAEISKVRKTRSFMIRDKGYLEDFRSMIWPKIKERDAIREALAREAGHEFEPLNLTDALVFSRDGIEQLGHNLIRFHFNKIIKLAEIDTRNRRIVPYSFRHFFITDKIMSGLSYRQISDICGTSASMIEKTYYHINEEIMRTNAMAGYTLSTGGLIEAHEHFSDER